MSASLTNISGQEFYRLKQDAISSGDIFEVDIAATGIAVGPDSDFSMYDVYYVDGTGTIQRMLVSVDQPLTVTLLVDNSKTFPGTDIPARLIIVPNEVYMPEVLSDEGNAILFPPTIDILFFTGNDPITPLRRAPKRIKTPIRIPNDTSSKTILFPTYGRDRIAAYVIRATSGVDAEPLELSFARGHKFLFPVVTATTVGAVAVGTFMSAADVYSVSKAVASGVKSYVGGLMDSQEGVSPFVASASGTVIDARGRYDYLEFSIGITDTHGDYFDPGYWPFGGIQVFIEAYDG